jgi:hypothetical protein
MSVDRQTSPTPGGGHRERGADYRDSPVFKEAGAQLRPMLEEPPRSAYYESDDVFAACAVR